MTGKFKYRWPTKLRKFGIDDPFLKLLVAKYESEIPWQVVVRDADTLLEHLSTKMLPRLRHRINYPITKGTKHVYLAARDIDLDAALTTEHDLLDPDESWFIKTMREEEGEHAAKEELVELLNQQKYRGFESWLELLVHEYSVNPAFVILLLRPILERSSRGTRRVVVSPSKDVIDWLHWRIARGRVSPSENLARVYCLKLGSGNRRMPRCGWQYVPSGHDHVGQLTGACRGSGWCVESPKWAARYLGYSCFYVLRHRDKPVVALRTEGSNVVECQGRGNQSPKDWFADIRLFLLTQKIALVDRTDEMESALAAEGELHKKPLIWWRDRMRLWPFAILLAPQAIRDELNTEMRSSAMNYVGFPGFNTLAERIGLSMDRENWCEVISLDPTHYSTCPRQYRETQEVLASCVRGWCELCEDGELTLDSFRSIPDVVRTSLEFQAVVEANLQTSLMQLTRQRPNTRSERENHFRLTDFILLTQESAPGLAREVLVNWLLNNQDGDFAEENLPAQIRTHPDFATIQTEAWSEAVMAQPPFLFAVPEGLSRCPGLSPVDSAAGRVDLESWCSKVKQKPWLLTQKASVPKSIRWHRLILEAYRDGWLPYLHQFPWRIWVKRGQRRVYMSYALLTDEIVINTLADGWSRRKSRIRESWMRASERMRNLPAIQLSVLLGVASCVSRNSRGVDDVARDIANRRASAKQAGQVVHLFSSEIRSLLNQLESR